MTIVAAFQSRAQLLARYGDADAAVILNNAAAALLFGGTRDRDDLQFWSTLAGERDEPVLSTDVHGSRSTRTVRKVPVLAPAQLANLPAGRVVAFRRGMPPVIGRAEQAHRRRDVRTQQTGRTPWWVRLLAPLTRRLARLRPPYPAAAPAVPLAGMDDPWVIPDDWTATGSGGDGGNGPVVVMARDDVPSIREIADLTRRLRALSTAGRDADPAERAAFLVDKDALLARIEAATRRRANHCAATAAQEVRPDATELDGEPLGAEHSATSDDDGEEWSR